MQSQTPLARDAAPRRECGKASEGARSPPENAQPRPSSLRPRDTQKVVRTLHGGRGGAGHGLRGPGQELRRLQRCAARAESEKDGPLHRSEPKGYSRTSGRALPGELGPSSGAQQSFLSPPAVLTFEASTVETSTRVGRNSYQATKHAVVGMRGGGIRGQGRGWVRFFLHAILFPASN